MSVAKQKARAHVSPQTSTTSSDSAVKPQTHLLFVNRSYWPDMEATGQLLAELCESLANNKDYEVSVLCGKPNFAAEGTEYKSRGTEIHKGVTIRRTSHTMFDKSKFAGRAINFLSFCFFAFFSLLFGKRPDVIVCQTDPPLSPIAACLVAFVRRTKFVCYLQDIYPDIAIVCGKLNEGFMVKALRKILVWCYCRADKIIVVSNDMRDWLGGHGVDLSKIEVIHNWVDTDVIYPIKEHNRFRADHLLEEKFVVMYSGNIGQTQRFEVLLDTAEQLKDREDIVFMFVGQGAKLEALRSDVKARGLVNTRFLGYQAKNSLAESLSAADIQIVLLDQRMTQLMMPSKLYSALASGTPIMGIGDKKSHLAQIIVDEECGWFFEETESSTMVSKIRHLAGDPSLVQSAGQAGRDLAVARFRRSVSIGNFKTVAYKVMNSHSTDLHKKPLLEKAAPQLTESQLQRIQAGSQPK